MIALAFVRAGAWNTGNAKVEATSRRFSMAERRVHLAHRYNPHVYDEGPMKSAWLSPPLSGDYA